LGVAWREAVSSVTLLVQAVLATGETLVHSDSGDYVERHH